MELLKINEKTLHKFQGMSDPKMDSHINKLRINFFIIIVIMHT